MTAPAVLLALLCTGSTIELVDFGPAMAQAGAVSTTIDSGAAVYYNPAGLGFRKAPQARVGVQMLHGDLQLGGDPVDIGTPFAILLELAAPVPLLEPLDDVIAVGIALHIIPDTIISLDAPSATEPVMPYYENRTQRLVVLPGLALRLHEYFSIGVGVNFFAALAGFANVGEGTTGSLQADVDEEIVGAATIHAGARFQYGGLSLGVSYRQKFSVNFTTVSDSFIADDSLALRIESNSFYTPETVTLGVSYEGEAFNFAIDTSYRRWSDYAAPFARVSADAALPSLSEGGSRLVIASDFEDPQPRDVWRLAVSGRHDLIDLFGELDVRAGYAYEPSPFRYQGDELRFASTNIIDGPKHILGLGFRWQAPDLGRARFIIDLASQFHFMGPIRVTKVASHLPDEDPGVPGRQTSNPGYPSLEGGGWIMGGMLGLTFEWLPPPERAE